MAFGRKTGGGSRAGKPNKNTAELKDMILASLIEAGGKDYLVKQSQMNPTAYMSLVGKVLPYQLTGTNGGPISVVSGVPRPDDDR